jgi:hypothetical protein
VSQLTFDGLPASPKREAAKPVTKPGNANGDAAWLAEAERQLAESVGAARAGGKFVKRTSAPSNTTLPEIVSALLERDRAEAQRALERARQTHANAVVEYGRNDATSNAAFDAWDKVTARKFLPGDRQYTERGGHRLSGSQM